MDRSEKRWNVARELGDLAEERAAIRRIGRLLDVARTPAGVILELVLVGEAENLHLATLLGDRVCVLGRGTDSDIIFDSRRHARVSLRHAEISLAGDEARLRDLDSRNGTFVNGVRLADESVRLADDDAITLGRGGPVLRVHLISAATP